ncbi:hypothetical protein AB1K54_06995 [Microbacterium sp. BWT-B31]|uniref:hypothetical protein n=1 Tax=Microbacterium sp. BWT-B31 TaxID=3232072 RepID=UPI0035283E02
MLHLDPFALRELLGPDAAVCHRSITRERGVSLPPLVDHHVHVHLIDDHALAGAGIAGIVDLGGDPVELARRPARGIPRAAYAGAFLTAPGGYPVGRPWAPPSISREVTSASLGVGVPGGARTAVDEQAEFGASVIKISLHRSEGRVLDDETLAAVVAAARGRGLPVVAHVEGDGMTRRAIDAGVDALAHVPFSERLDDGLVERAAALGQRWLSTLRIHDDRAAEIAQHNLERFIAAGGRVLYGTDLGNGDEPPGIGARELTLLDQAGLRGPRLVQTLTDPWPFADRIDGVLTFVPGPPPTSVDDVPGWLVGATVVPTEELVHDER